MSRAEITRSNTPSSRAVNVAWSKRPSAVRPRGMKPWLAQAVARIVGDHQRLPEEHLLRLGLTDAMPLDALAGVPVVPIEADDAIQVEHKLYITTIYVGRNRCRLALPRLATRLDLGVKS